MMVAFSAAMFANSYWYRGGDNSWGATAMTESTDGLYEYIQSSNNANQFKIATSEDSWDYGWTYVQAGFNSTDVTNIGDYGQDNCYCWQSGDYYILVYYPNTKINATDKPIICAATTLPEASVGGDESGAIKLTFTYYNSTTGDGSAKLNTVEAIFDAASQQYVSTVNTGTQVYAGRKYKEGNDSIFSNLKLGSSSAAGELKFTLANPTEVDSIVFRAAMYAASEGGEGFSVNGTAFTLSAGKLVFEDKVWKPTGEVSTIDIVQTKANKGRFFLTSITIYPKNQGGDTPVEIVLPVVKLAGSLTSWEEPVLMANAEDSLSASVTLNLGIDQYQLKVVSDDNWLSKAGDGDLYTMHRDWNHVDHLDLINTGDNIKLITDVEGAYTFTWTYADSTLVVAFPEAPAQPKFYITGNEDIVGEGNLTWGKNGALESFSDTLVMNLAAGFHKFKLITPAEQWLGMEALTDTAYGLFTDDDTNICFNIAEAGEVTVIYNATEFKVEGDFYIAPVANYYLIGDSAFVVDAGATADKAWTPDAIASFKDTTVLNLKAGVDYIMRLSLNGTWENHRDFRHLTDTAAGLKELVDEYENHSIGFQLAEAGQVTVIYIPAAEEQPEVFKLIGNFYVAPAPDPTVAVMGSMNDWAEEIPFVLSDDKTYASLTVENIGADEYEFKFIINGEWRSNGYRFHREFTGAAGITENNKANMVFVADQDGEYTFYWYFANDSAAIVYPEYIEPAKKYYAKYAPAWAWSMLTEKEGLWLTDTIVYKGIGININDKADDENNMFYSNTVEEEGVRPIAGAEIAEKDTIYFTFDPADSVVTAVMVGKYVPQLPVVGLGANFNGWDWQENLFVPAEDNLSASFKITLGVTDTIEFKIVSDGNWLSLYGEEGKYLIHRDWNHADHVNATGEVPNFAFNADAEGEYTFTWTYADSTLVVTFPAAPAQPKFKIAGSMTDWAPSIEVFEDSYTFENLAAGSYKFKVVVGDWIGFDALTAETRAAELYKDQDGNVCFVLAEAGNVTVTYTEEVFKVEGAFVPALVQLIGINGWTAETDAINMTPAEDHLSASVTLNLTGWWYEFKVLLEGAWLGKEHGDEGKYTIHNGWNHVEGLTYAGDNIVLSMGDGDIVPGSYTFTYEYATGQLTVTFPTPTALDEIMAAGKAVKIVRNGQILIIKGEKIFNAQGQLVK